MLTEVGVLEHKIDLRFLNKIFIKFKFYFFVSQVFFFRPTFERQYRATENNFQNALRCDFNHSLTFFLRFQDNVIEETMTVDAKHHRHFVAKRGEVLRHIGDEFGGVVVSFPRSGVDSDKVFIFFNIGCHHPLHTGLMLILILILRASSNDVTQTERF